MNVPVFARRTTVALFIVALGANEWAPCAGWQPTPEARQACCAKGGQCLMHQQRGSTERTVVSQADADRCCAASEEHDSTPSSSSVASGITVAVLVSPFPVLALAHTAQRLDSRAPAPASPKPVPKHLLFSVFLV